MDTENENNLKQLNIITILQSHEEDYIQCTFRVHRVVFMGPPDTSHGYLSEGYPEHLNGFSYRFMYPNRRGVDIDVFKDRLRNDGYRESKLVETREFRGEVVEIEFAKEIAVPEGQNVEIPEWIHWLASFYQAGE